MIQQFHSEENKNTNSKIYMDSNICTTLFTIAKLWKQSKWLATYELIKINYTHTMEYHSPTEKSENLPFVKHGWIWRIFMLSEINKKIQILTVCYHLFLDSWKQNSKIPGDLVVRIPHTHCRGPGFAPCLGN